MTNTNKLLPGILDDGIEFFVHADGIQILSSGKVTEWPDLPLSYIQLLKDEIDKDPDVKMHLLDMHPTSEYDRLEQFVKCRFGGLDYQADMTAEGIQDGEWWDCPLRGKCNSEGILCKAVTINGQPLDQSEVSLVKMIATNMTNEAIASEMHLPMGSYHLAKKKLYRKFGNIQTKQELTIQAQRLNII